MFKVLSAKNLTGRERKIMQELVEEHVHARGLVKELVSANELYARGDANALAAIVGTLKELIGFYPRHIKKEDADFFPSTETHLSPQEQEAMLRDFREFDQKMIHEKYGLLVKRLLT